MQSSGGSHWYIHVDRISALLLCLSHNGHYTMSLLPIILSRKELSVADPGMSLWSTCSYLTTYHTFLFPVLLSLCLYREPPPKRTQKPHITGAKPNQPQSVGSWPKNVLTYPRQYIFLPGTDWLISLLSHFYSLRLHHQASTFPYYRSSHKLVCGSYHPLVSHSPHRRKENRSNQTPLSHMSCSH